MRHTDDEIERAARRFEQLADELDPATVEVDHTDDRRVLTKDMGVDPDLD